MPSLRGNRFCDGSESSRRLGSPIEADCLNRRLGRKTSSLRNVGYGTALVQRNGATNLPRLRGGDERSALGGRRRLYFRMPILPRVVRYARARRKCRALFIFTE
jgi:hypothetical protein